jgi:peptide/nickel transport system permease protein
MGYTSSTMFKFVLRRLLLSIPVLLGITVLTFGLIHITPGGFTAVHMDMNPNITPDSIAELNKLYGLDEPMHVQYGKWLGRFARLDFGRSFLDNRPVMDKIAERIPATLLLSLTGMAVLYLFAIPLGVFSAMKHGTKIDLAITIFTFIIWSIPFFWLALLSMKFFGVELRWLPISGMRSVNHDMLGFWDGLRDYLLHLILPVFTTAFTGIASIIRYTRTNLLEVIRQDYIKLAIAKGLPKNQVYYVHALKNALLPLVTILGLSLPGILSGGFIVEVIFAWPGMGRLAYEALMSFDYPTVMGGLVIAALLTLLGNILADLLYAVVDPRIRL